MDTSTEQLLSLIAENAERDFGSALSLPPAIYHSQEILDLEKQRIFARGWVCAGRLAEIATPGEYIALDILDQAVFVIRQKDGSVKAFPNVCLHRCATLLKGRGKVRRVSCPYHSWTYELDGRLVGAPYMQRTDGFEKSGFSLEPLACETWQGFIYVNLDRNASSLVDKLAPLNEFVDDYQMADYVHVHEEHEVWNTNWKCLVENFMDVYHLHRVHAESFNKYLQNEETTYMFPGNDAFCWQYVQEDGSEHSVHAHPDNTRLKGEMRHRTTLFNVFPAHVAQLQPDLLWYLSIMPEGLDKVRIRWAVSMPQDYLDSAEDRAAHIKAEIDFLRLVNSEDQPTVESVFRATASADAMRGPLSWLERNCFDFGRYLARQLCD